MSLSRCCCRNPGASVEASSYPLLLITDMQALNSVDPGPDNDTQLRWQPDHQSTPLWRHSDGEEVPSVVKC
nr:hypothetical protein CFP56_25026 [Quercus suber]